MMAWTDTHYRVLMRLISKRVVLYTEMVTSPAILHGDRQYLLGYDATEHPLAVQLGGSDPKELAECAKIVTDFGYDEINLNVGCPSDRVQSGLFGACLMLQPARVAECVAAMKEATHIPVTVKTRIGVDDHDSYEELHHFINTVATAGCEEFTIHARKAWLKGLSPKENREIPPLRYDWVHQLKQDFPMLRFILNGGVKTIKDIQTQLPLLDGVMIGRAAYEHPYFMAEVDRLFFVETEAPLSEQEIIEAYLPYMAIQLKQGVRLRTLIRHLLGFFQGKPGARQWRRYLSEHGGDDERGVEVIKEAIRRVS